MCKDVIRSLEDQQLELMEQSEVAQREATGISQVAAEIKKGVDAVLAELAQREKTVQHDLNELESNRSDLADAVEETVRSRYERLLRHKGQSVVVGIQHGVCGGCHMKLSRQTVVSCQADQEIVTCVNCGRILFFTPDMDLAVAE
jgi:predicted  nucleic acid-binding Zn-ribbon protein